MLELREEIRQFIDSGADAVTVDEIVAAHPSAGPGPGHGDDARRHRHGHRRVAAAGVLVAAAVAVGLVVAPWNAQLGTPPASAGALLKEAAKAAVSEPALVPGPGQFLFVRTLEGSIDGTGSTPDARVERFYVQEVHQVWSVPGGPGASTWEIVGVPRFVSGADREAWEADGSQPLESGFGAGGTATYYDVADLPTKASRMAAYFANQSYLTIDRSYGRDAVWEFVTAADFLQSGASSTQRAALLRFMATIPGVRDRGSARTVGTDSTGTLLSIPADYAGMAVQAILDVATSQLLELRTTVTAGAGLSGSAAGAVQAGHVSAPLTSGQVEEYSDFIFDGIADSSQSVPHGAPPLPPAWPYGTGKQPAPGSVYP